MKCVHRAYEKQCQAMAEVRLIQDDGQPNPGGFYCTAHAQAIIREYRQILGEIWSTIPLRDDLFCEEV